MKSTAWSVVLALALLGCGADSGDGDEPDAQLDQGFNDIQIPVDIPLVKDFPKPDDPGSYPDPGTDAADIAGDTGQTPDIKDVPQELPPDVPDVPDPADVQDPKDVKDAKDCGPAICIDCACQCPDGTMQKYGGCFEGCETIPDEIKNCNMDCSKVCPDDVTGTPCWDGQCPEGYLCLEQPCTMCGMPPEPVCVPEPCPIDGCWFDWDCSPNHWCVGADFPYGSHGQCLPKVDPPQCWEDAHCPDSATCEGAIHCPPCYACAMPWAPGHCQAKEGQKAVLLWVDETYYLPGWTVYPVWYNLLDDITIFLAGCTTFTLEESNGDGTWKNLGPLADCVWEGYAVKLEPGDAHPAMSFPTSVQEPDGFGTYRLHGLYWTGCLDDQPISQAQCKAGPMDVFSTPYSVGPPPPMPPSQ